jgi:hypothetical protein
LWNRWRTLRVRHAQIVSRETIQCSALIVPRAKQDDYWLNIGVAFPHEDGQGSNVMLQALPVHGEGKLALRAYDPEEHKVEDDAKQVAAKGKAKT